METQVKNLCVYDVAVANYTIREKTWEGRKYLVVPAVMMKEGVRSGSAGPILHEASELQRHTAAWNGTPVMVGHPQDEDGLNVSANSPQVLEQSVGRLFSTHYADGLRSEVWIDVEKLSQISPTTLARIRQGRPLDVSVGIYTDEDPIEGQWGSQTYGSIARNYRPDHLALLPDEQGACSWNDGCGIRVNQKGGGMKELYASFKELAKNGYATVPVTNEQGYRELVNLLQLKLDAMDNEERMYYLEEVFDDTIVYRVRVLNAGGEATLYKRGYTMENGAITLDENPQQVRRNITYDVLQLRRTKSSKGDGEIDTNNKSKKEAQMNKENLCCEAKVDALIANSVTQFTDVDKEWLNALEESQIDKLEPKAPAKEPEKKVEVNTEEVVAAFKSTLKTLDDYVALMPEDMKASVASGVELYDKHREELVEKIQTNAKDVYTEEDLNVMNVDQLEKTVKIMGNGKVDYSAQSGGSTIQENSDNKVAPLLPPGVNGDTK